MTVTAAERRESREEYIRAEQTVLRIAGLTRSYTFLHITDVHACACGGVRPDRLQYCRSREKAFSFDGMTSAERMPYLFAYGADIRADLLLLGGDIVDFPSEENLSLLHACIRNSPVPSLYTVGNHDWNFLDNYNSEDARRGGLPRFADISGGDTAFHCIEYPDMIAAAVDNAMDDVPETALNRLRALCRGTKPVLLLLHVPLTADTLAGPTADVWRRNICMGPGGVGSGSGTADGLYRLAALERTSVAAVVAGHIHFSHEDILPNGVPQIVTGTATQGGLCRVIRVEPENSQQSAVSSQQLAISDWQSAIGRGNG